MKTQEILNTIIDTQKTRYFRFQKVVFLSEVKNVLEKEGIQAHLLTDIFHNQKYHSLVIGNLKNAKRVIISHYDTSNLMLSLIKFEPFEVQKRQKVSFMIDGLKSIIICVIAGFLLFTFIQNILIGNNIFIYSILSLIIFLSSVLCIKLPILLPSINNENKNTLKYMLKKALEKELNTAYVLVDDGMCYQIGYQILSNNLKQVDDNYEIELLDQIIDLNNIIYANNLDKQKTRLKYFDGLNVKPYTS